MKQLVLALIATVALAPAASARVRAVHRPSPHQCTFSLAPTWNGSIPAAGVTRAAVLVFGQSQACASWAAYSSESWATVEAAPLDAQPAAYVTIGANDLTTPRMTTLIVAGVRLQVTQEGATSVSPPRTGLVVNGSFDTDIVPWTWQSPRFPNGRGTANWTSLDANGSPASGSILLRDSDFDLPFQQLQCVPATKNTTYRYGAKVRGSEGNGEGVMAAFSYQSTDCSDKNFSNQFVSVLKPDEPGVWQEFSFSMTTSSRAQSVLIVIASAATLPPYQVWFDDVFLTKQ
jgi:hypothetical protein